MKRMKHALSITALMLLASSTYKDEVDAQVVEIAGRRLSPNEYLGPTLSKLYQNEINLALQKTTPQERAMALQSLAVNIMADAQRHGLTSFDNDLRNAYAQAIAKVFEQNNQASSAGVRALLTDAQDSPLLTTKQQNYIKNEMLPKLLAPPTPATTQPPAQAPVASSTISTSVSIDDITAAINAPAYVSKLDALRVLLKKAQLSEKFSPTVQDAFANALVTVFTSRVKESPTAQFALQKLLTDVQNTPLLTTAQKAYVAQQMLPRVSRSLPTTPSQTETQATQQPQTSVKQEIGKRGKKTTRANIPL